MFETSQTITEISKALLSVQNEFLAIKKEAQGKANKYTEYPELIKKCKPVLTSAGIVLMQPVTHIYHGQGETRPSITTILIHAESGEYFKSTSIVTPMTERKNKDGNPILSQEQLVGGGITYQKRYDLVCMLSWATGEYDLDQGDLEQQDKQTQFVLDSFRDLLKDFEVSENFGQKVMESVTSIDDIKQKKIIYKHFKDIILPKASEDEATAVKMLNASIAEL
jgi:hypothetical protein